MRSEVTGTQNDSRRRVAVVMAVALVLLGCSDAGEQIDDVQDAPVGDEEVDPPAPDDAVSDGAEDTVEPVDEEPEEVQEGEPRLALDLPGIVLETPAAGGGRSPELSWQPVDGAARYSVTIYRDGERAYWGWRGQQTSVIVGEEVGTAAGPWIEPGMTWTVMAFDADGEMIAQSGERPIEP